MPQLPLFVASSIGVAIVAAIAALLLGPTPDGHDVLSATGLAILGIVGLVGFVVTHGTWARRTIIVTLVAALVTVASAPVSAWWWIGVALTGFALYLAGGPPLDRWTRQLPPPEPLPYQTIVLPLALLATVLVAGASRAALPQALAWSIVSVVSGWAFARAYPAGLWAARIAVPPLGAVAAWSTPTWWQGLLVGSVVLATVWLAWSRPVLLAVAPLQPERVHPRPVFAEIAPDEVRRAAGLDRQGRRR